MLIQSGKKIENNVKNFHAHPTFIPVTDKHVYIIWLNFFGYTEKAERRGMSHVETRAYWCSCVNTYQIMSDYIYLLHEHSTYLDCSKKQ